VENTLHRNRLMLVLFSGLWLTACASHHPGREDSTETPMENQAASAPMGASYGPAVDGSGQPNRRSARKPGSMARQPGAIEALISKPPSDLPPPVAPPEDVWDRLRGGFALDGSEHERVVQQLGHYSQHPLYMGQISERAAPYLHYIVEAVESRGMPMEVVLLPVVESGFQPHAYSSGHAAGIWQFIPGTGEHYGLKNTWWYDGRRDVIAATEAALNYLDRLQSLFDGDWKLAFAAYNAGEGTVLRAIRSNEERGEPTDFWNLSLPRETMAYVPRLLAVRALIENPEYHQQELISIPNSPFLRVVEVGSQIDLSLAAELADISMETLSMLNPGFSRWATDPDGPHVLALPLDNAEQFKRALADLPVKQRMRWHQHVVAPGETLSHIASRYSTTVGLVQEANNLRGHVIRAGATLLVPAAGATHAGAAPGQGQSGLQRIEYTVRRGDSLSHIAQRYNVTVADLRNWNNIALDAYLQPGQRLKLHVDAQAQGGQGSQGGLGDSI